MDEITTWEGFGRLLRSLRPDVSLREVARAVSIGHSTLGRYELGQARPTAEATEALDLYFATGDRLTQIRNRLLLGDTSRVPTRPRLRYTKSFPAKYSGPVWVTVDRDGGRPFPEVRIRWGPWLKIVEDLEAVAGRTNRVALCFAKGNDGLSVPIVLTTTSAVVVQFGMGDIDGEGLDIAVVDINPGWVR